MRRNRSSGPCGADPTTVRSAFRTTHADTVPACRIPGPGIHQILGVVVLAGWFTNCAADRFSRLR